MPCEHLRTPCLARADDRDLRVARGLRRFGDAIVGNDRDAIGTRRIAPREVAAKNAMRRARAREPRESAIGFVARERHRARTDDDEGQRDERRRGRRIVPPACVRARFVFTRCPRDKRADDDRRGDDTEDCDERAARKREREGERAE